ncbi:MAG: erythronate-4-phosphate dehydrogenase [marine bacterium B5-7]|nr:MAG: erythronate-4-phosphate dehydrogenase [marine bacterium B5-7]
MSESLSIVADRQILLAEETFSKFGKVELIDGRSIDQDTVKNSDVLLVRSVTQVDEPLLKGSRVSFVGSATSGIDHIDTDYLRKSNISFVHAPGSNARSVAEYVLSSLLATAEFNNFDVAKKTVGIIGCGQVGSRVKLFLESLGVQCLLNDPPLAEQGSAESYVDLERILEADIITIHVPLTSGDKHPTRKLVDESFLARLKPDVVLINTSRGEVIDETALLSFKETNPGSTLILDVWCNEPEININLLQQTFIGTPHIAGYSYDGKLKATNIIAEALLTQTKNTSAIANTLAPECMTDTIEYNDDTAVQLAVMQTYDVRSDAIALRELITMPSVDRGVYFDSLRKNYPIRREFANRQINTKNLNNEMEQCLLELGFKTGAV